MFGPPRGRRKPAPGNYRAFDSNFGASVTELNASVGRTGCENQTRFTTGSLDDDEYSRVTKRNIGFSLLPDFAPGGGSGCHK